MTCKPYYAIALATAVLVVGCSDTEAGSPPTSTTIVTNSIADTTTTAQPSTTVTTEITTTVVTYSEVETAVRTAHTRFMALFDRDERIDGPEAWLPLVEELTTGPQLTRMKEGTAKRVNSGERIAGSGYDSNIVDVQIDNDRASVLDCSQDRGERYSPDGELLSGASDDWIFRETILVNIDAEWLVEDFIIGEEQPCDPNDY